MLSDTDDVVDRITSLLYLTRFKRSLAAVFIIPELEVDWSLTAIPPGRLTWGYEVVEHEE